MRDGARLRPSSSLRDQIRDLLWVLPCVDIRNRVRNRAVGPDHIRDTLGRAVLFRGATAIRNADLAFRVTQ